MHQTNNFPKRLILALFILGTNVFISLFLNGCTTNPATGKRVISFNSLTEEKSIGEREHPIIVKQFGGIYSKHAVASYITRIGNRLANVSELPHIGWRFTILNSGEVNAFAIPGGFIYITRGLLALADNEAELAGVLAHEIGHVTALHSSTRRATGTLAGLGTLAAGVLFGRTGNEIGSFISRASIQSYSQSQEFEADTLGVRYLSRAGYHTDAMTSFLTKMRLFSKLTNRKFGRSENSVDRYSIFASHPRTLDRLERTIQMAKSITSGNRLGRVDYLEKIHGVIYGDDLKHGLIRGRSFIHPILKFQFTVPKGFRLINSPSAVIAKNQGKSIIQFDMVPGPYNGSMHQYIRNRWAPKASLKNFKSIIVNGMMGSTALTRIKRSDGVFDLRFVAIHDSNNQIFRMLFLTPLNRTTALSQELRRTTLSLRMLTNQEASKVKPFKITVKAVGKNATIHSLSNRMKSPYFKEETFRVLNGLGSTAKLRKGQLIKLVTY